MMKNISHADDLLPYGQSKMSFIVARVSRRQWDRFYESLDALQKTMLRYQWDLWARKEQKPPSEFTRGEKTTWMILGGRGMGKTRPGAETVIEWSKDLAKNYGRGHIALVGKDPGDTRDVMIEGAESGILACSPPWYRPVWEPTKRMLNWGNGVIAHTYSSETPEDLRGPQHHKAWGDELPKWKNPQETWDHLQFGLRLGEHPQTILTNTPRPIKTLIDILHDPNTCITTGKTSDNVDNLSPTFLRVIYRKYEGTRLGRQELNAEVLSDTPGALWTLDLIDACRVKEVPCSLTKIVIAIDPGVTDPENDPDEKLSETGIIAVGYGENEHTYVLHDLSGHYSAGDWGEKSVSHAHSLSAEEIIGETNNGGDLVEFVVRTAAEKLGLPYKFRKVTASRGKRTRAEPISAKYEQRRQHHVGVFPELEDQMTTWVPGLKSPDRMDAMVWGSTAVAFEEKEEPVTAPQVVRIKGF
jgi:phage terminase large subunit-like protein